MNTIVMNLYTGAVSEYAGFDFEGITDSFGGKPDGLYRLQGDTDAGSPIISTVTTAETDAGTGNKKLVDLVHAAAGPARMSLTIVGRRGEYKYLMDPGFGGTQRKAPGRGIRENYMAFRLQNPSGQAFVLDWIEVLLGASKLKKAN